MLPSRGMGAISRDKVPKKIMRRDADVPVKLYSCGGMAGGGLYENINKKRKRIAAGSGEKMRKPGAPGAPTAAAFKRSAKTAKK